MMQATSNLSPFKTTLLTSALAAITLSLTACGGGGGGSTATTTTTPVVNPTPTVADTQPPVANTTTPTVTTTPTTSTLTPETAAFDSLNSKRTACGFGALTLNNSLSIAAINHANYLSSVASSNSRPFASHNEVSETDYTNTGIINPYYSGKSVTERLNPTTLGTSAIKTAYDAAVAGENISVSTYGTTDSTHQIDKVATAQDMLTGLLAAPYHIRTLVLPQFKEVGISYREAKWLTSPYYYTQSVLELVSATPATIGYGTNTQLLNYPCDNVVTAEKLTHEEPNPIPNRDLKTQPIGQPIYVLAPTGKTIASASAAITSNGASVGYIHTLTAANDPHKLLNSNEAIFIPDQPLALNTVYNVTYYVTYSDGTKDTRTFSFKTQQQATA